MYVVKVGDYYVKDIDYMLSTIMDITLSQEVMRGFTEQQAKAVAKKLNGEVIEMREEVTCE